MNEQIRKIEQSLVAIENEPEPMVGKLEVSADEAAKVFRETLTECDDPKQIRAFVASITDMIVVHGPELIVHYKPECLVQMDGHAVHSKHMWLLDLGSNQGPTD